MKACFVRKIWRDQEGHGLQIIRDEEGVVGLVRLQVLSDGRRGTRGKRAEDGSWRVRAKILPLTPEDVVVILTKWREILVGMGAYQEAINVLADIEGRLIQEFRVFGEKDWVGAYATAVAKHWAEQEARMNGFIEEVKACKTLKNGSACAGPTATR